MYDLPETISLPYQIVFRPYLLPSTKFCRSFLNDFLLPLAKKKNLVSPNLVPVQTPKIQFHNNATDIKNKIKTDNKPNEC